jgi:hypothetical protein
MFCKTTKNGVKPHSLLWLRLLSYTILAAIFIPLMSSANPLFVSDQLEITLRTGPSTTNKITKMLRSGDQLNVLTTNTKGTPKYKIPTALQAGFSVDS